MDTSRWLPQEIVVKPLGEIVTSSSSFEPKPAPAADRKPRPQKEQALNCPRCNSTNTKFCYYNNYSLTQPRYFCKGCRRYWTDGGSLRNIPVGGGSRKNKRSSSSSSRKLPDLANPSASKARSHEDRDLNLGFPSVSRVIQPSGDIEKAMAARDAAGQVSALELLSGVTSSSSRGIGDSSFIPMPIPDPAAVVYGSSFGFADFKPSLSFSLDLIGPGGGFRSLHHPGMQDGSGGRILFPFEDPKGVSGNMDNGQQGKETDDPTPGYWTGMLGGGPW